MESYHPSFRALLVKIQDPSLSIPAEKVLPYPTPTEVNQMLRSRVENVRKEHQAFYAKIDPGYYYAHLDGYSKVDIVEGVYLKYFSPPVFSMEKEQKDIERSPHRQIASLMFLYNEFDALYERKIVTMQSIVTEYVNRLRYAVAFASLTQDKLAELVALITERSSRARYARDNANSSYAWENQNNHLRVYSHQLGVLRMYLKKK